MRGDMFGFDLFNAPKINANLHVIKILDKDFSDKKVVVIRVKAHLTGMNETGEVALF